MFDATYVWIMNIRHIGIQSYYSWIVQLKDGWFLTVRNLVSDEYLR